MFYTLNQLTSEQYSQAGKKFSRLAVLRQTGFRVPMGYVVPATIFSMVTEATSELMAVIASSAIDDGAKREALAADIRRIILTMPLPEMVIKNLGTTLTALRSKGYYSVAVRSSPPLEGLAGSSFAGCYESILNITNATDLGQALRRCWASAFQPSVLDYCCHRDLVLADIQSAVLIQGMIPAEVAGVLFTADPVSGDDCTMIIKAVLGLGESLVQSEVDPENYRYRWYTDEVTRDPEAVLLSVDEIRALGEIALTIQEHFGTPQNIEWAYLDGEFHILQAQSIAAIHYAVEEEWTNAYLKDGGGASSITTPLMWSLYEMVLEETMPRYLAATGMSPKRPPRRWTASFFGYPYCAQGWGETNSGVRRT
ncbi:Phosphoenolpyruvate synthase (modular protein) [Gammaproteobacteria bacterium]